jgi:hypothetical protein
MGLRLEQPIKGLSWVLDFRDRCRCLPFYCDSSLEELATVPAVFRADPLRHWLGAFKSAAGIEIKAVLASMHVGLAMWALTVRGDPKLHRHHPSAHGTPEDLAHTRKFRPTGFFYLWLWPFWLLLFITIHIPALFIFSSHIYSYMDFFSLVRDRTASPLAKLSILAGARRCGFWS